MWFTYHTWTTKSFGFPTKLFLLWWPKWKWYFFSLRRTPPNVLSPVWGAFVKSKNQAFRVECDKYELFDNHCFEKLELKYCKAILGVHRKSSNAAVRGEVGRHPTLIRILKQGLKNWFRVTSYKNKESVLYDTYLCNIELQNAKKNCWWANLKLFFTQTLGLSSLLENHGCKNNPKYKILFSSKCFRDGFLPIKN